MIRPAYGRAAERERPSARPRRSARQGRAVRQAYRNVALAWAIAACLVACSPEHRAQTTSLPNRGPAALQSDDVDDGERTEHAPGGLPRASGEGSSIDADGDGIDDATELALAQKHSPYYTVDSRDRCSRHGVRFPPNATPRRPK